MKKFIIAVLTLFVSIASTTYAADYSSQLNELKDLLSQCKNENMAVPYEIVGVSTFERFIDYLAEDEKNGVSSTIMTYNETAMQNLYSTTKANLTAYLNGEKNPPKVPVYDMMNISTSGMELTDGRYNVISTGYGHFNTVINDIERLDDFGMVNMQFQTGPKHIIALPDWAYGAAGGAEHYFDVVEDGYDRALKIVFSSEKAENRYFQMYQEIPVSPSTKYYFKASYKGTNVTENSISIRYKTDGSTKSKSIETLTGSWQDTGWQEFTTGPNDTSVKFSVFVDKPSEEIFLDDIIVSSTKDGRGNLLFNGDFERIYSQNNVSEILTYFERAKNSNVSVSLLLQPMYFWRVPGCSDMYKNTTGTDYNINDPRAKAKIEQYLRTLLPLIADCDALGNICVTNEPNFDTRLYPDFYNPKFREYLIDLYGSFENIKSKYGKSYSSINDVVMPASFEKSALFYDWICFNEDMLTEWHSWMASIIREYTDKPLHSKVLSNIGTSESSTRKELVRGADIEKFAAFTDYAGNDAANYIDSDSMVTKMLWYDLLYSVVGKPIYNSEDHFIEDGSTTYNDQQKNNVRYNLWQGAIHGRTMSTMWVWDRSYDANSAYNGSILTRPDCVAEAGYTSLDMMRSADDITRLSSKAPEVALFYSKTDRIFNDDYLDKLILYYQALLFSGKRVGIVTEASLNKLSNYSYLVIPYVSRTTPEAITAINNFIDNGGVVVYTDNSSSWLSKWECMAKDKFGNSLDNSKIISKGTKITETRLSKVTEDFQQRIFYDDTIAVVDSSSNNLTTNVEYVYEVDEDGGVLINMVYHGSGDKTVKVLSGSQTLSGMINVLTKEITGDTHTLTGYVPLTLKLQTNVEIPSEPQNLKYDGEKLTWDVDLNAESYSIYYTNSEGEEVLYAETVNNSCTVMDYGVYTVVPQNILGQKGPGASITIQSQFDIEFNTVNITDKGVTASVNVSNKSSLYQRTVMKVTTAEGKIAISDIWLKPMEDRNVKVSFTGTTEWVTASVSDDVNSKVKLTVKYKE